MMAFSRIIKEKAFKKAKRRCQKCGKLVTMGTSEAHHIHHVASGGGDRLSNARILCINCHKNKSLKKTEERIKRKKE